MAVPLGDKTGFQHAKAIVLSHEMRRFGQELTSTAAQLRDRTLNEIKGTTGPDSTGPDSTGPDSTNPNSTGPNSTGPNSTGPDSEHRPTGSASRSRSPERAKAAGKE
jgi:hypothetical protein